MFCAKNYGTASKFVKVIQRKLLASFFLDTVYRPTLLVLRLLPRCHRIRTCTYVIVSDNVRTRAVCLRYFAVYEENKLCVSYLQPKFTKVSTKCVTD